MPTRPPRDVVTIATEGGKDASILVDRATQYEITTDMLSPSTARFELGDESTWADLRPILGIGSRVVVSVNGWARIKGRLLTRNLAVSTGGGATVQVAVRTMLADAMFSAVDTKIGVNNVNLKDLIIAAFSRTVDGKSNGITEKDFVFEENVVRNVLTGRSSSKVAAPEVHTLREDEARPHAGETQYGFVDRHLSRFSLLMWDAPDGRIVIGKPDDTQNPIYTMRARKGPASRVNNILTATKVEDFEEVPRDLWVFGVGGGKDLPKSLVKYVQLDVTLAGLTPLLTRTAIVVDESIHTEEQAAARARREMMRRSLQKDSWTLTTDGFAYWSGSESYPYVIGCVSDVGVDVAGGANGAYLIYQCSMRGSAHDGHTTTLVQAGRGVWQL
jgi:prophage tail gpP-like protein